MPIGDAIGEGIGAVLRIAGRVVFEIVFELLIKGAGNVLIRVVRPKHAPSEVACGVVGIVFWLAVAGAIYGFYRATAI